MQQQRCTAHPHPAPPPQLAATHQTRRQYLQNRRKFELRAKGRLDTATGQRVHFMCVGACVCHAVALLQSSAHATLALSAGCDK
jgi:hypothetical protein